MTLPATDTVDTYGGLLVNYQSVEDPTTDRDASAANQAYASIAAATHMVPRAYVVIQGHATTPTVLEHDAVWGNASGVVPVLTRNGTGDITIAWPATVTAEDTTTQSVALKRCVGYVIQGTSPGVATVTPGTNPYEMQIRLFNLSAGAYAANDFAGIAIVVMVR